MPIPLFQVDAFTDKPFTGNPAAVCLLGQNPLPGPVMQQIAAENNLAETAFVTDRDDGSFGIRWFTPTKEVDLCGHATLASAFTLKHEGLIGSTDPVIFHCAAHGELVCATDRRGMITLDFPADQATPIEPPSGLIESIGIEPAESYRGRDDYLLVLKNPDSVEAASPDYRRLAEFDARGVIVTSSSEGRYDVVSRCFFPRYGIDEDPVTGSAHCLLGPFWAGRLGKSSLHCRQASSRGGEVFVHPQGPRVKLAGRAVMVIRGALHLS